MSLSRRVRHFVFHSLCGLSSPSPMEHNICFGRRLYWGHAFWMPRHILVFSGGDMNFWLSLMFFFCSWYSEAPGELSFFSCLSFFLLLFFSTRISLPWGIQGLEIPNASEPWEALALGQTQPNDINWDNLALLQICFSEHTQLPKMFIFSGLPNIHFVKKTSYYRETNPVRVPRDGSWGQRPSL